VAVLACVVVVSSTSCAVFAPERRDAGESATIPAAYRVSDSEGIPVSNRWWEEFGDEQLNGLIAVALTNNLTIAQAEARLRQARALEIEQRSALFPEVAGEASASVTERESDGTSGDTTESYSLGIAASYELDLWGRVRSLRRSAGLDAAATEADRNTAAMTIAAEVALRYFELLATRQGIALLEQQLETSRDTLELIELRFRRSQVTALDVLQQRQEVAGAEARLPQVRANEQILVDSLSVLLGRSPSEDLPVSIRALPELPPVPEAGIPADLLARRPDIRSAWLKLLAVEWDVSAAKADRLPAIRLSASAAYSSDDTGTLFDNWILNLAGSLTAPFFDAGRRRAEVERQKAIVDERLASYRETVFEGVKDVQDALRREAAAGERLSLLRQQLDLADSSRAQAMQRYLKGQENYLRVLTATLSKQQLQRDVVTLESERISYRIALYRALGGDWLAIMESVEAGE